MCEIRWCEDFLCASVPGLPQRMPRDSVRTQRMGESMATEVSIDTVVSDASFQSNRRQMLEKVQRLWIKGVLEPSLEQLGHLELALENTLEPVDRLCDLSGLDPAQAPHPLPPGTPISRIFDDVGHALLILGEPGAGKTTLLLELTRTLLDRAAQHASHLIPVVFNLSSWSTHRFALT